VSNSSSSSFILIGFITDDKEIAAHYSNEDDWCAEDDFDSLYNDFTGKKYSGALLSYGDSSDLDDFEYDIDKLWNEPKLHKAMEKFGKEKKDVRLYGGIISS
jgi:hypothetical protein